MSELLIDTLKRNLLHKVYAMGGMIETDAVAGANSGPTSHPRPDLNISSEPQPEYMEIQPSPMVEPVTLPLPE